MLSKIHHIGIVVRSLEAAYGFYRDTLSLPVQKEEIIQDQGVKAALLTIGEGEIELLEPMDPNTGVARFLARHGEGLHHLCFATDDVHRELDAARAKGLPLIDQQPRPGLAGLICFLHPKASHGVLIEYAQPLA
jgi:methylmalonyl-CoA/ethylmalonyl-CoA epimerase